MPDLKLAVPAILGIGILVLVVGSIGWLLDHPVVIVVGVTGAGLVFYGLARWSAQRNRV